jgi:hypothetical protein
MTDVIGARARKNCDRPHVAQKPEANLSLNPGQAEPDITGPQPRAVPPSCHQTPGREDHMDTAPLTLLAQKVSASHRLLFADLRRLRRNILPMRSIEEQIILRRLT